MLTRYQSAGIAVVASPACGAWRWISSEPPAAGACERSREPRYWQDRSPASTQLAGPPADEEEPVEAEPAS